VVVKTIGDNDGSIHGSDGRKEGFFVEWFEWYMDSVVDSRSRQAFLKPMFTPTTVTTNDCAKNDRLIVTTLGRSMATMPLHVQSQGELTAHGYADPIAGKAKSQWSITLCVGSV
jgi:hypothetical protein